MSERSSLPYLNRITLSYFPEQVEVGARFVSWPRHMTIVPWFMSTEPKATSRVLKEQLVGTQSFIITAGELAEFEGVDVRLIKPNGEVMVVQNRLIKSLGELGISIIDPKFSGDKFSPHITIKPGQPDTPEGQRLLFDSIVMVAKQSANEKRVIDIIELGQV